MVKVVSHNTLKELTELKTDVEAIRVKTEKKSSLPMSKPKAHLVTEELQQSEDGIRNAL